MPRLTLVITVLLSAVLMMRYPRPGDSFAAWERARVRAHLDSAERELRSAAVTGLTARQRAARVRALARLHEYWVRGVFPQNADFPGQLVPYFIDRNRTRCAMAYLIEESGARTFAARVAATRNNARIPQLKSDPRLIAWLDENGMTLEEAARVQPGYCTLPCPLDVCCCCGPGGASTGYKVTTGVSVGADVVAVALNAHPTRMSPALSGALGVAAGVIGVAIGAPNFDQSGSLRTLGFLDAGAGAVSAAFGVYRLTGKRSRGTPVSFAPWFRANGASGLSGRITF